MRLRIPGWPAFFFAMILTMGAQGKPAGTGTGSAGAGATSQTAFVYVPYDKTAGPAFGGDQSVLLPYAEFLRLKNASQLAPDRPDFRPGAAVSQASYTGSADGNVATLEAEFTIEVLARPKDTLVVQLPFDGAAVERATIEGAQASLAPLEGGGGLAATLTGEGKRTVKLRLAAVLGSDGAVKKLEFHVPRAAAASIKLRVADDVALEIIPDALPATTAKSTQGGVEITASAGSKEKLLLAWRPRVETKAAVTEARFSISQDIRLSLSSRSASARVKMHTEFLAGSSATFVFNLPDGAQLLGVTGSFVKDWTPPAKDGRVSVALVREVSQPFDVTLDVKFDEATSPTRLTLPEFIIPGAARLTGEITVAPDEGLAVWPEESAGLEPVSVGAKDGAGVRKFRFAQPGWKLILSRRPIQARMRSEGTILYEITDEFIRLKTRHHLSVSGRGIFSVSFDVPEGYELRDAGPPDLVSGFRQSGRRVEVNLRGEQRSGVDIDLRFQRPRGQGESKALLQPVAVVDAEEDAGSVVLAAPVALKITEASAEGLQATDVRTLKGRLAPLISPEIVPVLGYRYFTPVFQGAVSVEKQRTRLSCETSLLASITPSLMKIDATLAYNVEFSAVDEFQLLVPSSVGEDVRFTGADIKEKSRSASNNSEMSTWTVRLQRRVIGPYRLGVSFEIPLPEAAAGKSIKAEVPPVRALNVARETGFIAVLRGENLEVSVAKADGLESRDVKELPPALANAFLGFRYFEPEKVALSLDLMRHEIEPVLGALIRRLHIDTVLTDQREAMHEAIFEVQNNREQYLALKLPAKMEIWGAFVRGVPVRPTTRESDGARLIELTKSESKDDAFRVRLVMHETLPGGALGMRGRLVFDSPDALNMPVLRVTRKLYLPRNYRYLQFGGSMKLETGMARPWVEPAADKLLSDFPADLAGGQNAKTMNPPVAQVSPTYDTNETDAEKRARLQGTALEFQIVREGAQFEFSKLSGTGTIEVSYWKQKPLLILQGVVALLVLALLLWLARGGRRPFLPVTALFLCFIGSSLAEGSAARFWNPALAAALGAFGISVVLYLVKKSREAKAAATEAALKVEQERLRRWEEIQKAPPPVPPETPPADEPKDDTQPPSQA